MIKKIDAYTEYEKFCRELDTPKHPLQHAKLNMYSMRIAVAVVHYLLTKQKGGLPAVQQASLQSIGVPHKVNATFCSYFVRAVRRIDELALQALYKEAIFDYGEIPPKLKEKPNGLFITENFGEKASVLNSVKEDVRVLCVQSSVAGYSYALGVLLVNTRKVVGLL